MAESVKFELGGLLPAAKRRKNAAHGVSPAPRPGKRKPRFASGRGFSRAVTDQEKIRA
jgi:hypothetical protein